MLAQELIQYLNLCFELFERECNIINGDWTLLSCINGPPLEEDAKVDWFERRTLTRVLLLSRSFLLSPSRRKGKRNSLSFSRICHFPSKRASERSPNSPAIRDERANRVLASTRWINTLVPVGLPLVQGVPVVTHFLSFTDARRDQLSFHNTWQW